MNIVSILSWKTCVWSFCHYLDSKICLNNFSSVLILYFFFSDTSTCSSSSGSNSLFDTETNDISKMIVEILNIIAVNVRFYNSRYFDMHCKLFQHKISWQEIIVTTKLYSLLPYQMFFLNIIKWLLKEQSCQFQTTKSLI